MLVCGMKRDDDVDEADACVESATPDDEALEARAFRSVCAICRVASTN